MTGQTSINTYSMMELGTPTTFKKRDASIKDGEPAHVEPLLQAYCEPRTFLNVDDEEEARRSKERFLDT